MRISSPSFLPRPHHGFGSRRPGRRAHTLRAFRHWLRQATDRAIGNQLADDRFNPFLYLSPRC